MALNSHYLSLNQLSTLLSSSLIFFALHPKQKSSYRRCEVIGDRGSNNNEANESHRRQESLRVIHSLQVLLTSFLIMRKDEVRTDGKSPLARSDCTSLACMQMPRVAQCESQRSNGDGSECNGTLMDSLCASLMRVNLETECSLRLPASPP